MVYCLNFYKIPKHLGTTIGNNASENIRNMLSAITSGRTNEIGVMFILQGHPLPQEIVMICITPADTALALAVAAEHPTTKVSNKDETKWVEIKHDVRTADLSYDVNSTATKAEDYLTTNARRRETWAREADRRGSLVMPVASDPMNYVGRHRN
jgi:hypothetical protein